MYPLNKTGMRNSESIYHGFIISDYRYLNIENNSYVLTGIISSDLIKTNIYKIPVNRFFSDDYNLYLKIKNINNYTTIIETIDKHSLKYSSFIKRLKGEHKDDMRQIEMFKRRISCPNIDLFKIYSGIEDKHFILTFKTNFKEIQTPLIIFKNKKFKFHAESTSAKRAVLVFGLGSILFAGLFGFKYFILK